jgi:hypothetical protein
MSLCNTPVEPCYFARRVRAFFCLFSGKAAKAAIGIELDWIGLDWIGLDWIGLDKKLIYKAFGEMSDLLLFTNNSSCRKAAREGVPMSLLM